MRNSRKLVHVHKYSEVCWLRQDLLGRASFSRFQFDEHKSASELAQALGEYLGSAGVRSDPATNQPMAVEGKNVAVEFAENRSPKHKKVQASKHLVANYERHRESVTNESKPLPVIGMNDSQGTTAAEVQTLPDLISNTSQGFNDKTGQPIMARKTIQLRCQDCSGSGGFRCKNCDLGRLRIE